MSPRRQPIPASVRAAVLDAEECHYCTEPLPWVVDHLLPVTQGGTSNLDNLVAACAPCNSEKSDRTPSEWRAWRIDRGLPWPPPREGAVVTLFMAAAPVAGEPLLTALRARDAVVMAALDAFRDRVWTGTEDGADREVERLVVAVDGLPVRLERARRHLLEQVIEVIPAFQAEVREVYDSNLALPMEGIGLPDRWRPTPDFRQRVATPLAHLLADLSARLLTDDENDRLAAMVTELRSRDYLRDQVAEIRPTIAAAFDLGIADDGMQRATYKHLARDVARFAAACGPDDRARLAALIADHTGNATTPACTGAPDLCGAAVGEPCRPGCPSLAADPDGAR